MACSCGDTCTGDCRFTRVSDVDFAATIVEDLIPTVDEVRDLKTQFGLRAYEVKVVVEGWTGGQRGKGDPYTKTVCVILPTPKVAEFTSLEEMVSPIGRMEQGSVRVSEISGRYTEDQLMGRQHDGDPAQTGTNVFWEIQYAKTRNKEAENRRFTLKKAPTYKPEKLQWVVELERARGDRDRDGRVKP